MNETKPPKGKKEKVGADGLSKKERRALKIAEQAKNGPVIADKQDNFPPKLSGNNVKDTTVPKPVNNSVDITTAKPVNNVEVEKQDTAVSNNVKVEKQVKGETLDAKPVEMQQGKAATKKDRRARKVSEKSKGDSDRNSQNKPAEVKNTQSDVSGVKVAHTMNTSAEAKGNVPAETEGKSKAQVRAERRELQEKQRLAKLAPKDNKADEKKETKKPVLGRPPARRIIIKREIMAGQVQLFNHLYFKPLTVKETSTVLDVHPSFIRLGAQYASKTILGSNARCLALLSALKDLIDDFVTPPKQDLCRSLETCLQTSVTYLQKCRPFAVSMTNALRHFKVHSTQVKTDLSDVEKKALLQDVVDVYIEDEIHTAGKAISMKVSEKITNDDVILTYGGSSLIMKILTDARKEGKSFKVIVVDSRPLFEGREMLRKLVNANINCSYTLVNAASYIMTHATKVLLGAHSLLANGYVMARTGTAQVALVARAYNKPVLVCCETYKFCERVQTDSFVYNEIGNPCGAADSKKGCLTPLNLMYDVTPPDLVTAVVTELGFLPCTSVPVVLRIKPTE